MPSLSCDLLSWYDRHARRLPWRAPPGQIANPYHVLLSEFLLQQTTVKTVIPYFHRFITLWPTLECLATAPLDEILKAFAGLGYYRRARFLHACAHHITFALNGRIPTTAQALHALPGVGPYMAQAIASIAFNEQGPVVDGNILRIGARLFVLPHTDTSLKQNVTEKIAHLTPAHRPGDFAQAMMDLGATICTPRQPACDICPIQKYCAAYATQQVAHFPTKAAKAEKPHRLGTAFMLIDEPSANILLCTRPPNGLLGHMTALPCHLTEANTTFPTHLPFSVMWQPLETPVVHVFTHFKLYLRIYVGQALCIWHPKPPYFWQPLSCVFDQALPTLMRKAIQAGLDKADFFCTR